MVGAGHIGRRSRVTVTPGSVTVVVKLVVNPGSVVVTIEPSCVIVVGTPGSTLIITDVIVAGGKVMVEGGMTIVSPGDVRVVVIVAAGKVINCVVP